MDTPQPPATTILPVDNRTPATLEAALRRRSPFGQWSLVEVTFPPTAGVEADIPHTLTPPDPDQVGWIVVRSSGPGVITRTYTTDWRPGVIRLRSTQPSHAATLLLFVPTVSFTLPANDASGVPDGDRINYTPTVTSNDGSTPSVTSVTAAGSYSRNRATLHLEVEADFTVGAVDATEVYVTLPLPAVAVRNTATNFRIWRGAAAGYGVAQIDAATPTRLRLMRGDSAVWTGATQYACYVQITYFTT